MHTSGKKKYWKLQCKRIIELIICFKDGIPFSYFSRDKFRKTLRIFSRVFNHFTKNISAIISNGKGSLSFIPQTPEIRPTQQVIQKILMQIFFNILRRLQNITYFAVAKGFSITNRYKLYLKQNVLLCKFVARIPFEVR